MFLNWFGRRARRTESAAQAALLAKARTLPLCSGLDGVALARLAETAERLAASKSVQTIEPLSWGEEQAELLFLLLALPVFELGAAAWSGWREILLYPQAFLVRDEWHDAGGLVHEGEAELIGQARLDGPVLLSWPDVEASARQLDGWNVAIHEMAHKLDMLSGEANGCPPLHKGMDKAAWTQDWSRAYQSFCRRVDRGAAEDGWLDPYAAESPAEFFAVLSESFFELPELLRADYPELYRHLAAFYRQDPAGRLGVSPQI
jgi:Mlc titration factor MtfA (ptsG expression regulator)